jgi:hypothetical protein
MADARERHLQEIERTKAEIMTAKGIHRKDLTRHLYQLKKDLKMFDHYHNRG